jgi:hypothetical protein
VSDEPPDAEDEAFRRLHEHMNLSIYRQTSPEVLELLLSPVHDANRRAGFLAWDPEMLAKRPVGDPGRRYPRLHPVTEEHPRLFISYSWAQDLNLRTEEPDHWADAFAGFLFGRGYDIVFDRDPRNVDKGLSWFNLLTRMNDCNYFIVLITEKYLDRIPSDVGPAAAEWKHAVTGYPDWFTFIGIWRSGAELPHPLSAANVLDIRSDVRRAPWSEPISHMFPPAAQGAWGHPLLPPPPQRPPDPSSWPAYVPY